MAALTALQAQALHAQPALAQKEPVHDPHDFGQYHRHGRIAQVNGGAGASDLHITLGAPPMLRVDGLIIPTPYPKLSAEVCQRLIYSLLTDTQKQRFESMNELDMSFGIKDIGRVRMNVFRQRGVIGAALRSIPQNIQGLDELGLPPIAFDMLKIPKGLVLVTGDPTGIGQIHLGWPR
jgi:twitching motility protein PilT